MPSCDFDKFKPSKKRIKPASAEPTRNLRRIRHRPIEAGDVNMTTTNFNPAKDLNTLEDENELLTYERDSLKESYRELKDEINRIRFNRHGLHGSTS